jgi:hypothetical protein
MKKYIFIGLAVILGILLLTNPSPSDFKAYIGKEYNRDNIRRTCNFLVFSTYEVDGKKFRGILKNFSEILPPPLSAEEEKGRQDSIAAADAAMMAAEEAAAQQAAADSAANAYAVKMAEDKYK